MSAASGPAGLAAATRPVLGALLDEAHRRDYRSGVLGVRARPEWTSGGFEHAGAHVTVKACPSVLAVREALVDRSADGWLVVLTDREETDLGAGVLTHLLWHRLRTPDPWEAVKQTFRATGLDPALTGDDDHRRLATGLLELAPAGGWPVARGGVLTREHALDSVAEAWLGIQDPEPAGLFAWTVSPGAVAQLGSLRARGGDVLTTAVLHRVTRRLGVAAPAVQRLLEEGRAADCLALGLVAGVLVDAVGSESARYAFVRAEPWLGRRPQAEQVARQWSDAAVAATRELLESAAVLRQADRLLADLEASQLAGASDLLPAGLRLRLAALAEAMTAGGPVEQRWLAVEQHRLAATDPRVTAFRAAVRLTRWQPAPATSFSAMVTRHVEQDGWVDAAVSDAHPGVGESALGSALEQVLSTVRTQRNAHDRSFAEALARHTSDDATPTGDVLHLEDVLAARVLPLAAAVPVLFLLLDGMSVAVATEVVADVQRDTGWREVSWSGRRAGAVAVLPTLTEVSRASLFSGALQRGQQGHERDGFTALAASHGLQARLFHKKPVDTTRPGHAVADEVGAALDDVAGLPLVACVLNTIDDALDRSDPGGTDWGADAVRHLRPLLSRAAEAGRVVVVTADHGHVIERRRGELRVGPGVESGRSRSAEREPVDGEVLVRGRRVLTPDHAAVLAVDEAVRFAALKAGYHGGASPAEVVVPLVVLLPPALPLPVGLTELTAPVDPDWWSAPLPAQPPAPVPAPIVLAAHGTPSLFDQPAQHPLVAEVLASATYRDQARLAPRRVITDDAVAALLTALLVTPARRLPQGEVVRLLGVAPALGRGAVTQLQQLFNVDGYDVVAVDGDAVVLHEQWLREQFELS